jgi:hypothetical protein
VTGHTHQWAGTHDRGIVCADCGEPKPESPRDVLRARMSAVLNRNGWDSATQDAVDALLPVALDFAAQERDRLRDAILALADQLTDEAGRVWIDAGGRHGVADRLRAAVTDTTGRGPGA